MKEKGLEVGGSVGTTWWPSLTVCGRSMPYCRQYPGICHLTGALGHSWGPMGLEARGSLKQVVSGVLVAVQ